MCGVGRQELPFFQHESQTKLTQEVNVLICRQKNRIKMLVVPDMTASYQPGSMQSPYSRFNYYYQRHRTVCFIAFYCVQFATDNVRFVWGQLKGVLCRARGSECLVCFCSLKGRHYAEHMKLKLSVTMFISVLQSAVLLEGLYTLAYVLIIGLPCVVLSDSD